MEKKIIHIDMDSFFASIEIRDNPRLATYPVAVGGQANSRGIICTANYIAREYGVHSAMPTFQALRLCPALKILPPNIKKYKAVTQNIRRIFTKYSDLVEPMSIDEAYLDVSNTTRLFGSATLIANAIREEIYLNENITASAGVSINKFIAKVASDFDKPNGITVIPPNLINDFVKNLPIKSICGVGPVTALKMMKLNIHYCHHLQQYSKEDLYKHFGKFGIKLYDYCLGIDNRILCSERNVKSTSIEHTFPSDIHSADKCQQEILLITNNLIEKITKENNQSKIKKVFVKVKFSDFRQTTIEHLSTTVNPELILNLTKLAFERHPKSVRLLGLGVRYNQENQQLTFNFNNQE